MTDVMIKAEGLGKSYLIGHHVERERYTALRDVIMRTAKGMARSVLDVSRGRQILAGDTIEEFWALRDIDFEIRRGEVVGFIGRNGAGKSTLLKVLSRITEPTEGKVTIRGRVASLLEVGTGFHPELTGRENIFLNGAILGMSQAEVRRKFDEIVEFAEVERFVDTPVKRYSSGMYVRLAFSVAAHLEPEILIVDEVLAVGDAAFQRKCLGKMDEVAQHGRTVLFVSHNMATIERLCDRGVLLSAGRIVFDGETPLATREYLSNVNDASAALPDPDSRPGSGAARVMRVECPPLLGLGEPLRVKLAVAAREKLSSPDFRLSIYNSQGVCIANFSSSYLEPNFPDLEGEGEVTLEIPQQDFNAGSYTLTISISDVRIGQHVIADRVEQAASFQVDGIDPFGTGKVPYAGALILPQRWMLDGRAVSEYAGPPDR